MGRTRVTIDYDEYEDMKEKKEVVDKLLEAFDIKEADPTTPAEAGRIDVKLAHIEVDAKILEEVLFKEGDNVEITRISGVY